jgi:hypothetical protein
MILRGTCVLDRRPQVLPLQHAYAYVGNNPVNRIDPYGLWFNSLYEAVGTLTLAAAGAALATVTVAAALPLPPPLPLL